MYNDILIILVRTFNTNNIYDESTQHNFYNSLEFVMMIFIMYLRTTFVVIIRYNI